MNELDEYREKLLNRFARVTAEFRAACLAARNPQRPIERGGWNVHQVAAHTRDVDKLVYGARVRRTLAEGEPAFANFDGEAYMAKNYDPSESLLGLLGDLEASVQDLLKLLRDMPQSGWSRLSSHETQGGGITLQAWVERDLQHIEEHLQTVMKAAA